MAQFRVVVTDHFFYPLSVERSVLEKIDTELVDVNKKTNQEVLDACRNADGLINLFYPIDKNFISELKKCRVISRYGTGVDNVDVASATEKGIVVANVPSYCTEEVSDQAMALLYACARRIIPYHLNVKEGKWDYTIGKPMFRIRGQILGLLGFGNNAKALASKAKGVGLQVIAHDPFIDDSIIRSYGIESVSFKELLTRSDYISIHCSLTEKTRHLFSINEFKTMKKTAFIINTARGGIIDSNALYQAIKEQWIAGAGLEVTDPEPLPLDNPLRNLDNIIFNPHTGWYSEESTEDLRRKTAEGVLYVLEGKIPPSFVNKDVLNKITLRV